MSSESNQNFIKDIAKYFMTFLETDFKKRRLPKRNANQRTAGGNKVCIDVEKYTSLKKILVTKFFKGFSGNPVNVQRRKFTHSISDNLQKLILSAINKIDKDEFYLALGVVSKELKRILINIEDYDLTSEEALDFAKRTIAKNCLVPFLTIVNGPLSRAGILDENARYQIEVELIDTIFDSSQSGFFNVCQKILHDKLSEDDIVKALKSVFVFEEIRTSLKTFFEELEVNDFFDDLYELFRNNAIIDKTELYFYFSEISFDKDTFPIFYVPITVTQVQETTFTIEFDKRIFVNSKAVDYVVQEFNKQTNNSTSLSGAFDRIIYTENEANVELKLKSIISQISHFFQLSGEITLDSDYQRRENLLVSVTNKCFIYLFDKSDESLINDYETILNDDSIKSNFSELIDGFVKNNPVSIIDQIDTEWMDQTTPNKLVFESPVPLNEEQKQVLAASQKKDCSFMILEGPPGTGKSHTITAIICKALLEEKTVLVLSDKKEALDVVEDKITETLNRIRRDEDFQNPILRIGKAGNKFSKIVQGQTVAKIKEHYRSYKSKVDEHSSLLAEKVELLKDSISGMITTGKKIEMPEIIDLVKQGEKYEDFNWFVGVSSIPGDILNNLLTLKSLLDNFRNNPNAVCSISEVNSYNRERLSNILKQISIIYENKQSFEIKNNFDIFILFSNDQDETLANNLVSAFERIVILQNLENKHLFNDAFGEKNSLKKASILSISSLYNQMRSVALEAKDYVGQKNKKASIFSCFKLPQNMSFDDSFKRIERFLTDLNKIKIPVFGFLFSRNSFSSLLNAFKRDFLYYEFNDSSGKIVGLENVLEVLNFIEKHAATQNPLISKKTIFQILCLNAADEGVFNEFFSGLNELEQLLNGIPSVDHITVNQYAYSVLSYNIQRALNEITTCENKLKNTSFEVLINRDDLLLKAPDPSIKKKINNFVSQLDALIELEEDLNFIKLFVENNKKLSENLEIDIANKAISEIKTKLDVKSDEDISSYINFVLRNAIVEKEFNSLPKDSFSESFNEIEQLVAAKMAYFMDGRIIDYIESNAADVNTLKLILRKKQKFPKELFEKMKKAFPCILAGIRDYAEYIPLSKNLFDLIVIDEASQVSIAQALPALIRGSKVIVLGDDKQFSNVKSQNASTAINNTFKARVRKSFLETLQNENERDLFLTKVEENFNIKNSILKFVRFIRNYECILRKHFRCYPEIISYSNKYFYSGYLQCMKIRGCPIEDVLKIEVLEHDGLVSPYKNINELEADFIVSQLESFVAGGKTMSIGIISPHREQVQYLIDRIYGLSCREQLLKVNKLKIMTFDTCQGEERDYIFYSMVATLEKDRLNWIFIKDFKNVDIEAEGTIKAQRLNVGFSRAKDTMHFVLSKPIDTFSGEIRNALVHYRNELNNGAKKIIGGTDKNSPMEEKIQHYFYETEFYKNNIDDIELIPQFSIGEYLKQLDKTYSHPFYKVDFLLVYKDEKIIIEYDGFKEHFVDLSEVNSLNYDYYMSEDDVYRQTVLEGYGYKFLRINKFNIGDDPVHTLNARLSELVKKKLKT